VQEKCKEKTVTETLSQTPLMILGIIGLLLLAGLGVYLLMSWGRNAGARNDPLMLETEAGYREDDVSHAEALSAKNASERPTEDDMQAAVLGPRGVPNEPSPARMTPQRAKKTPRHLEPGHTA
jgi:hypothetical protein